MSHVARAELLADLGRYDEAADELVQAVAAQPDDVEALTLLARVLRAAGKSHKAIEAVDAAVAAAPTDVHAIGVRGLILVDLARYGEAAASAELLLRAGPDDAYAQTTAALILGSSRNGQPALNAAWRGVSLAPENPQAHLILAFVCGNLGLKDLAERAYREALRLDPQLPAARQGLGLIRLEQRRYTEAIEHLTEAAAMKPSDVDGGSAVRYGVREVLYLGAGYALVSAVLVGFVAAGGGWAGRAAALVFAAIGIAAIAVFLSTLRDNVSRAVASLVGGSRSLTVGVWAVAAEPALLLGFAIVTSPWLLAALVVCGAVALFSNLVD